MESQLGKGTREKVHSVDFKNCNLRFPLFIPGCKLKSSSVCIICIESKGEKERYTHLNSEFQRIARRDKEAFHSDQCKEIEENNRIGKTRDLFKKIRDTKETFHAKMGTRKDRNGMDLTEAEDIKKRWQEYTEVLSKRSLMTQVTMMV